MKIISLVQVHQQHTSCDKSFQVFPRFSYGKREKLGVESWE